MSGVTAALCVWLVADVKPQCAQSLGPSVESIWSPVGMSTLPLKFAAFTRNVTNALRRSEPLAPRIESVDSPWATLAGTVIVTVDVPDPPTIVDGANTAVAPAGRPSTLSATPPTNPPVAVAETL